jgi:dephospho-CoA kinase
MILILCITGMPGSGKSIVSDTAKSLGFRIVSMGDVIRKEAEARGMEMTPASVGALMLELREKEGPDAVAKRCLADVRKWKTPALVEGVRNPEELDYFKNCTDILLIAVHASPATRFERLLKRARPDDPKDLATFRERDLRELRVGLGSVIAQADKMFLNEGTLKELQKTAKKYFEGVKSGNKGAGRG